MKEFFGTPSATEITIVLVCFVGLFICGAVAGLLYALSTGVPF